MEETLLTPDEVARRVKVTERTVYNWLKTGRLVGVKLGRLWRVRPADLECFLQVGRKDGGMPNSGGIPPGASLSPEERAARIRAACGSMAHLSGSVDDFLRRKHEDNDREEARWEQRQRERERQAP